jgi:hypothetical protein
VKEVKQQLVDLKKGLRFVLQLEKRDDVSWEAKYDLVFSPLVSGKIRELSVLLGLSVEWTDPDLDYEDDLRAYCRGCEDLLKDVTNMIEVASEVWAV